MRYMCGKTCNKQKAKQKSFTNSELGNDTHNTENERKHDTLFVDRDLYKKETLYLSCSLRVKVYIRSAFCICVPFRFADARFFYDFENLKTVKSYQNLQEVVFAITHI